MPKYISEVTKHFSGDKTLAARYMGVARGLLGSLVDMSGDVFQNARKVILPDGTKITVSFAGALARIAIDVRSIVDDVRRSLSIYPAILAKYIDDEVGATESSVKFIGYKNCRTDLYRTKKQITGCVDWIDHSGLPQIWVSVSIPTASIPKGIPAGWVRYSLGWINNISISRDIYFRDGSFISLSFDICGFTRFNGHIVYAKRVGNVFHIVTPDGITLESYDVTYDIISGYLTDQWIKFNATGDEGVLLLSTRKYLHVKLTMIGNTVNATFTVNNMPITYSVQESRPQIYSPGPPGHPGYSLMEGYSYSTNIVALDYIGDDLNYLYVDEGVNFWNIHYMDVPDDSPYFEYRGIAVGHILYRVGNLSGGAVSYFNGFNGELFRGALTGLDLQVFPGDVASKYTELLMSDLDIRRFAASFDGVTTNRGTSTITTWESAVLRFGANVIGVDGTGIVTVVSPLIVPGSGLSKWFCEDGGTYPNFTPCGGITRTAITTPLVADPFSINSRNPIALSKMFCFSNNDCIGFAARSDKTAYKQYRFCAGAAPSDITSTIYFKSGIYPEDYGYVIIEE